MGKKNIELTLSNRQLENELKRSTRKGRRWKAVRRFCSILIVFSAIVALAVVLWFPVYYVTGKSMEPNLKQGQIVMASRLENIKAGDIAALYYENQILIRRVIGMPGDLIGINDDGSVSVNGMLLEEPYLKDQVLGASDLTYPYQVPEGSYFLLGDNRAIAADSRMSFIGCIKKEKAAGKIIFSIWPLWTLAYIG